MTKQEVKNRIEKLKKEIDRHRYLYHVLDKPEISDAALDSLKHELFNLELQYPEFISPDSPTQRVGGEPLDEFEKVAHSSPMLSLEDIFSFEELSDWEARIKKLSPTDKFDYYAELKMDGLAVCLIYKNGIFIEGSTRGNGLIGENVTQNLKTIEAIPLRLRVPTEGELVAIGLSVPQAQKAIKAIKGGKIEVRGEAIITKEVFEELNKELAEKKLPLLANPRNAAAGSIRQLDSKITAFRHLDCYIYSLLTDLGQIYHKQEHQISKLLGFKVLSQNKYCKDLREVEKFHAHWLRYRDQLPFEVDGIVTVVNNLALEKKLGTRGKAPRWMIAYKFPGQEATTIVTDIIVQIGRTGILTPIAVLRPVQIGGVIVSRATLHNEDEIERLGIKIGDTVIVARAGDVIPDIVRVLPNLRTDKEKDFKMPQKCPFCGAVIEKIEGKVAYRCPNKNCFAQNKRRLAHFVSRQAMDIDGLGPKIIEQLIKAGLVSDPSDFYKLKEGDLLSLERFAEKSALNLIESINKSKKVTLNRFIYALGIRQVGEETARDLAENFGSLDKLKQVNFEELSVIRDVGPVVAKSIYEWFRDKHNSRLLDELEKTGVKLEKVKIKEKGKFNGLTFVLTGELESMTRDEAKEKIRALGGDISESISKKTDYVIVGKEPGSKYDKALKLKAKTLNEGEFLKLLSEK